MSMGLHLPENSKIEEIIICYQLSNSQSFISQIRLTEMKTPDHATVIRLKKHNSNLLYQSCRRKSSHSRYCCNAIIAIKLSEQNESDHAGEIHWMIDGFVTTSAAITLALRLNFQNTNDKIMLGTVGIKFRSKSECCCVNVRDFGAIGDGNSHPHSERYTSLSDAQIDYPDAESLDDEIDWAAIQTAFHKGSGTKISVPCGVYILNRSLGLSEVNGFVLEGANSSSGRIIP